MAGRLTDVVVQRRQEMGLSQGELARASGVSRPTVIALEQGKSLRLESLEQILAVLGMRLSTEVIEQNEAAVPRRVRRPEPEIIRPGQRFPTLDQLMRQARELYG